MSKEVYLLPKLLTSEATGESGPSREISSSSIYSSSSSDSFKLGSLHMPWRKKESKAKSTAKWYVGLDRDESSIKVLHSPIKEDNEKPGLSSFALDNKSSQASSSSLASELSDTRSSLTDEKELVQVTLRRGISDRKFNPSIASQDSAYLSMTLDSSRGTMMQSFDSNPELDDEKMITSPVKNESCDLRKDNSSAAELFQKNTSELESSRDSGLQGSVSSWSSSITSSILTSSLNTSFGRESKGLEEVENVEEDVGDENMSPDAGYLYRVCSCPMVDEKQITKVSSGTTSPDEERCKRPSLQSRHGSDGNLEKSRRSNELKTLNFATWCNCSLAQRNRYSLDFTCLFAVQSSESALKTCSISYESCPDILNFNSHYSFRSRSVCSRCSRIKRGSFSNRRPNSVAGRLHRSERSPESPNSYFRNSRIISVS